MAEQERCPHLGQELWTPNLPPIHPRELAARQLPCHHQLMPNAMLGPSSLAPPLSLASTPSSDCVGCCHAPGNNPAMTRAPGLAGTVAGKSPTVLGTTCLPLLRRTKHLFVRRYVHLCAWNQPLQPPGLASLHWARVGRLTHTTTLKPTLVVNDPPQVDHRTVLDTIEGVTVTVDQSVAADPMTWHNLATSCALPAMVASRMSAWRSAIHRTTSSLHMGTKSSCKRGLGRSPVDVNLLNFASRSKFWALNSSSAVASLARRASISATHAGGGNWLGLTPMEPWVRQQSLPSIAPGAAMPSPTTLVLLPVLVPMPRVVFWILQ